MHENVGFQNMSLEADLNKFNERNVHPLRAQ